MEAASIRYELGTFHNTKLEGHYVGYQTSHADYLVGEERTTHDVLSAGAARFQCDQALTTNTIHYLTIRA